MEQARQLLVDTFMRDEAVPGSDPQVHGSLHGDKVVLLTPAADITATRHSAVGSSTLGKNWPEVLERVRGAAQYMRTVESRAEEQEFRVQELLEQVRADMQDAHARVQAAEKRTRDVQAQANKLIQASEERARIAQERTATIEGWLVQISEAIETEFVVEPVSASKAGMKRS
ncbi:hypothetical protein [Methylobacterium cerastii]|uniref:hypothetical protein n=1 Tax=Methylobacterium cerastii TaxID=932741 RepID=UPI001EE29DA6|nr:hypothetical protein [Methylobacterium cerastii]